MRGLGVMHMQNGRCKFYEWDEDTFILPSEYILDENNDLADALKIFYLAGGYDFFNVIEAEYYASNWLDYVGNLYRDIMDNRFNSNGKNFTVPLTDEQKQELLDRGVPEVFVTNIE